MSCAAEKKEPLQHPKDDALLIGRARKEFGFPLPPLTILTHHLSSNLCTPLARTNKLGALMALSHSKPKRTSAFSGLCAMRFEHRYGVGLPVLRRYCKRRLPL